MSGARTGHWGRLMVAPPRDALPSAIDERQGGRRGVVGSDPVSKLLKEVGQSGFCGRADEDSVASAESGMAADVDQSAIPADHANPV